MGGKGLTHPSKTPSSDGYHRYRVLSVDPVQPLLGCGGLHSVLGSRFTQHEQNDDGEGERHVFSDVLTLPGDRNLPGLEFYRDTTDLKVSLVPR